MALSYTNNKNYYKNHTDTRIITDEPTKEAEDFREYSRKLSKIIVNSEPRFTVGIFGDWGTGKTTLMQMIQDEIDRNYSDNIQTVWFDAWRYEREEYSAMIPLLRTIILSIGDTKNRSSDNEKKEMLKRIQKGFIKIVGAILRNTTLKAGISLGAKTGTETNSAEGRVEGAAEWEIDKIMDDFESEGSFRYGKERFYFYKHITDHLKEELQEIRKSEKYNDFKIIIFIDDLDRCTPDRALGLLESIKTFFDIEGIIYVIGIDPTTIDPIIRTKYENNPKIDGMHYLEKIVQLPFTIPVWSSIDLSNVIRNLVKEARLSESYSNEILKETNQELIIKATQLNPRDIKRFINSIVLARDIYGHHDIKDIDKIIAIQAFYFHGHKWIEFLKLLTSYEQRVKFLTHFILLVETKLKDITTLDDLRNIIEDEKYKEKEGYLYKSLVASYRKDKSLNDIYKSLIEKKDNDLFIFLKIASEPLLKIDKIESYLRIVDTTGITIKRKDFKDIDSEKQLKLLHNQKVKEFNDYYNENVSVHLPYAELQELKLQGIKLDDSVLFKANLSEADLSEANLSRANLSRAKLSGADLYEADLSEAYFFLGADLTTANLSRADLSRADLSEADLSEADLSEADLSGSIIVNNIFSEDTVVKDLTNFKDAIIYNHEFLKYLRKNQCRDIPEEEIRNKQELRLKLESKNVDKDLIDDLLESSKLPSTS